MENYESDNRKNVETCSSSLSLSNYEISTTSNETKDFHIQKTSQNICLSIETLMKKVMLVVTEKRIFISGWIKSNGSFWIIRIIVIPNEKTVNNFRCDFCCRRMKSAIEVWTEQIKPVVMEKSNFEHRDKSITIITLFFIWDNGDFNTQNKFKKFQLNFILEV